MPTASVRVDGRLDDEGWRLAPPVTDFVQAEPVEGAVPTDPMEVRFLYDEDALFVGARLFTRTPSEIQAPMSRRDEGTEQAEHVFVSIDPYHDRRTAYTFGVTAAGVRLDHYHADDNRSNTDRGFDPVWDARVGVDEDGWVAELRIPFNQLRFTDTDAQVWGLNIYRLVPARNEEVYWSLLPRTERVWASRFGELHGILGIRPTTRIELLPYVAGASTPTGLRDRANPFDDGRNLVGRAGVDMKIGLGPNLTLDATINPDFGQIEADPAEVNSRRSKRSSTSGGRSFWRAVACSPERARGTMTTVSPSTSTPAASAPGRRVRQRVISWIILRRLRRWARPRSRAA